MPSKLCSTCSGVLAIVGVAALVGAAHSVIYAEMNKPIVLEYVPPTSDVAQPNAAGAPAPVDQASQGEGAGGEGAGSEGAAGEPRVVGHATGADPAAELERVRELYEDGYVFLDARPLYQYEQGHIPDALWMPSDRVTENGTLFFDIEDMAGGLDQPIVIYCGGGDCDASENLAMLLQQAGFTNLVIFKQGYPAWVAAGLETQVGAPLEVEP